MGRVTVGLVAVLISTFNKMIGNGAVDIKVYFKFNSQ